MFNALRGLIGSMTQTKARKVVIRYDHFPTKEELRIDATCFALGIDIEVRDDFFDDTRIDRAFEAMFSFGEKEPGEIEEIYSHFWNWVAEGEDFASALAGIIELYMVLEPEDAEDSLSIQRVFWEAHGMGYAPGMLYPFVDESSPVYRRVHWAIKRANRVMPIRTGASEERAIIELTNLICGSVLSGRGLSQAVDDAFMTVCFDGRRDISRHDAEWLFHAQAEFWLTPRSML